MTLVETLKKNYPQAFEIFRTEYLRKEYEYWREEPVEEDILWFCDLPERMQLGYFLDYMSNKDYNVDILNRFMINENIINSKK